jgi:hypothetical protein
MAAEAPVERTCILYHFPFCTESYDMALVLLLPLWQVLGIQQAELSQ